MTRIRTLVLLLVILSLSTAPAFADPVPTGRLDYRLSWNGIPAAQASVRIVPDAAASTYRVEAVAQTGSLVDLLWRLRAHVASSFTSDDLTPLGFSYDRDVNHERSVTDIAFGPSTTHATGIHYRRHGNVTMEVKDATVLDPITAIFQALAQPIAVGRTLQYDVFTGEARYRVVLPVTGEDVITVPAGTYTAWRVEPRIWKLGTGLDTRVRQVTIWVAEEPVHAVLRIRSEVFIGAVNCDLLSLAPLNASAAL